MISILHLITDLDIGGAEATLARLVTRLDRKRFCNTVVSLTGAGAHAVEIARAGVLVHCIDMHSGRPSPAAFIRLARLIRRVKPDVLQTWLHHADFLGTIAGKVAGVPRIYWNLRSARLDRSDHPASLFMILRLLARLSPIPAAVVVNSGAGRQAHEALGYRPRRWALIPNGIDTDAFAPSPARRDAFRRKHGIALDVPVVGLVARWHPMKDHATFLAAASQIAARRPTVRFAMVGRGIDASNAALRALVARHGLDSTVVLCGEAEDSTAVFPAFDVAVSSSYSEAFPNVVAEAMSCGVPCVATDAGDSAQIVSQTGAVVPSRNPTALGDAVDRMIAMDSHARTALGRSARARIEGEYSLDVMVRHYEDLYQNNVPVAVVVN